MEKNIHPKKLDPSRFRMFGPKSKQEERKNEEPKKPSQIKKLNITERLPKMNNNEQSQNKKNENTINFNTNSNIVLNRVKFINKKEKDLEENQIKLKAEIEENERKWKQQISKGKKQDAPLQKNYTKYGPVLKLKEDQKVNICMDLSTRLANFFIYGYKDNVIKYQLPNCVTYKTRDNDFICDYFSDRIHPAFSNEIKYLVKEGMVDSSDLMESFIENIIRDKMNFDNFENCSVLFTEPINFTEKQREEIKNIFFEYYNIEKLFIIKPSILALLSEGKYTGVVAELDYDISSFIPIFDCCSLEHAIIKSNLGRKEMNDFMKIFINQKYQNLKYKIREKTFEYLIEKSCYVALDFGEELNKVKSFSYILPDDQEICFDYPRIQCPEILFNQSVYYKDKKDTKRGIVYDLNESINKCDIKIKKELYNNIVLTGINSKFNGMEERIKKDLKNIVDDFYYKDEIKITRNEQGIQKGVEAFLNNPAFESKWYTRDNYEN